MNDSTNGIRSFSNGNGNGNGNGHEKIFNLTKNEDPLLSTVVPQARIRVSENTKIPEAARMFFSWLTDMSLRYGVYSRKGVVKFSDSYLAARFKRNAKTIRNWKRAIETTGEVWLTEKHMKNSFPQTVYNITAIVGSATLPLSLDSEDGSLVEDEIFSSNRRRMQVSPRNPGTGQFARRYPSPVSPLAVGQERNVEKRAESAPSGKILPPTTATNCRPPRQSVAAHHGNPLPTPTATNCRPARKPIAAPHGKPLPLSAATNCRAEGQPIADKGETRVGGLSIPKVGGKGNPPPDEAFETWNRGLEGLFPSKLLALEKKIKGMLQTSTSQARRDGLKRQLKAVQDRLLPPVPPDEATAEVKPPKPVPTPLPATVIESGLKNLRKAVRV